MREWRAAAAAAAAAAVSSQLNLRVHVRSTQNHRLWPRETTAMWRENTTRSLDTIDLAALRVRTRTKLSPYCRRTSSVLRMWTQLLGFVVHTSRERPPLSCVKLRKVLRVLFTCGFKPYRHDQLWRKNEGNTGNWRKWSRIYENI